VSGFFARWIEERTARVSTWRNDESRLRQHVEEYIGTMRMNEVRARHVAKLFRTRLTGRGLAPRAIRNIHSMLRAVFRDAMIADIVRENPCVLGVHHPGKVVDKNPNWRHTAVFTRDEVEQILSDERIPEDRRAYYSLLFLAELRFGEAAARRWRDYEPDATPLGLLHVATAMHAAEKREKGVETERPRDVPVHPTLARVLGSWKLQGWPSFFGRSPGPDDLIVPSGRGTLVRSHTC